MSSFDAERVVSFHLEAPASATRHGPPSRRRGFGTKRATTPALLFLLAALVAGCGYREIQQLEELAAVARNEIEVQLQRRAELVPSLWETVQEYGAASGATITAVAEARAELVSALRAGDLAQMRESCATLSAALSELLQAAGRNAELLADPGFQVLRSQLEATENEIEQAGRRYNEAARRYNDYIAEFPQLVTARVTGAQRLDLFGPSGNEGSSAQPDQDG